MLLLRNEFSYSVKRERKININVAHDRKHMKSLSKQDDVACRKTDAHTREKGLNLLRLAVRGKGKRRLHF